MKLRNKNTGEIGVINLKVYGDDTEYVYDKLETLYNDWEDYKPKEPLIVGKDFIELFKHWAEINEDIRSESDKDIPKFVYEKATDMLYYPGTPKYGIGSSRDTTLSKLEDGKVYSYYDLVGEE